VTIEVRQLDGSDESSSRTYVAIVNAVTPESPTSPGEIAWEDATYPDGVRFLARLDGELAGAGSVGRIYMYEADYERLWFGLHVLPPSRRHGLGTALWAAASAVAREAGKTGLQTDLSATQVDGLAFLEHRGFGVAERSKMLQLDLRGMVAPDVAPPAGIEITTYAERPDLVDGLHRVALEAYADIPTADEPVSAGSIDEFAARDVRRDGIPPGGFAIAIDAASGDVAGWASLMFWPGSTTLAWHDMTAVARAFRGRGVATALKRATIAWAIGHGLETLETGNDPANAPMRAVNLGLGYRAIPDVLTMRGPLAPSGASRRDAPRAYFGR
jgi:GNAT superfamily N-acetyltransferase